MAKNKTLRETLPGAEAASAAALEPDRHRRWLVQLGGDTNSPPACTYVVTASEPITADEAYKLFIAQTGRDEELIAKLGLSWSAQPSL